MGNIELRMPDSLVKKLDTIGAVDELTRGEVIRQAVREWIEGLDWKWYVKEHKKLGESEPEGEEEDSDTDEEDVVVNPEDIEDETEEEDGDEDGEED